MKEPVRFFSPLFCRRRGTAEQQLRRHSCRMEHAGAAQEQGRGLEPLLCLTGVNFVLIS